MLDITLRISTPTMITRLFKLAVIVFVLCCVQTEQTVIKVSVPEDKPSGYVVHRFTAPPSGEVYIVLDSRYMDSLELLKLFGMTESGVLTTKQPLTYNINGKNTFEITVVRRKRGENAGGTAYTLQVQVTDINNNVPTFGFRIYNGTIWENSPENTKVKGIVNCHAEDKDSSGIKQYKIIDGNQKGYFKLDTFKVEHELYLEVKTTNIPIVVTSKDDEKITLYIQAEDNGTPALKAVTKIVISVITVNKHTPKFEKSHYKENISEDLQILSTAVEVHAVDMDSGADGSVYYILKPLSKYFTVNPVSGNIEVIRALNYLKQKEFDMTVYAIDRGIDHKQSSAKVTLAIQKDLQHYPPKNVQNPGTNTAPVFKSGTLSVHVREDLPVDAFVILLRATENDPPGPNRELTYTIAGDTANTFKLDPETGLVTLRTKLDYELSSRLFNLTVTATDKGSPPLSSSTYLVIYVDDVNENFNPPNFEPPVRSLTLREDTAIGTSVMTVSATDSDPGDDGKLIYSALSGEGTQYLNVDETTGVVSTIEYLDREKNPHFELLVVAHDSGNFPLTSRLYIVVTVDAVDDHYPEFLATMVNATVPDGSPENTFVTAVHAVDLDGVDLIYMIKDPGVNDPFKVDTETGVITTRRSLDKSKGDKKRYQLTVEVKHGARVSQTLVNINVTSSNGIIPRFTQSSYDVAVRESMGKIDSLICLVATDNNYDGMLKYTIRSGDLKTFAVAETTGELHFSLIDYILSFYKVSFFVSHSCLVILFL